MKKLTKGDIFVDTKRYTRIFYDIKLFAVLLSYWMEMSAKGYGKKVNKGQIVLQCFGSVLIFLIIQELL